jgi:uncharacterized protein
MQRQPLPKLVDARKFAAVDSDISASVPVSQLPRFVEGLAGDQGLVDVDLHFFRDDQGFYRIEGKATTRVEVLCQRCLEAMPIDVDADFELAIVWTDEQAKALPKTLDPVLVGEEALSLYELVQDELILNMPFVSYHQMSDCAVGADALSSGDPDEGREGKNESGDSPFSVLGQLWSRDK